MVVRQKGHREPKWIGARRERKHAGEGNELLQKRKKWVNCSFAFPFPGEASICSPLNPLFSAHFVRETRADKSRRKKQTCSEGGPFGYLRRGWESMASLDAARCVDDKGGSWITLMGKRDLDSTVFSLTRALNSALWIQGMDMVHGNN